MAKLISTLFIAADGVVEIDPEWHFPYFDENLGRAVGEDYDGANVLLLGRKTYDSFAGAWPEREDAGEDDAAFARQLGDVRKIVVSRQPLELSWRNAELVSGELVAAVRALRSDSSVTGILLPGSISVVQLLLDAGLVDELHLYVHPVAARKGRRLFTDGAAPLHLSVVATEVFPTGVMRVVYAPVEAPTSLGGDEVVDEVPGATELQTGSFVTTVRGDRVAYDLRGSGPALIFVAGAGPYRAIDPTTTETAERMAGLGVTTLVYDRLGRGESPVEGRIDLDRELEAIAALIEVAGGSAALCGHSSGCSISMKAAASGLAVTGLALWEAPLGPEDGGAREWADEVDRRITAGDLDGAQRYSMKDMPPEFLEGVVDSPMWPALVAQVGSLRPDGESLAWAESAPLDEVCAEIRVPVLIMVGEETFPSMVVSSDALATAIPTAVQRRMPGAMHSWAAAPMAVELASFVTAAAAR